MGIGKAGRLYSLLMHSVNSSWVVAMLNKPLHLHDSSNTCKQTLHLHVSINAFEQTLHVHDELI